MIQSLVPDSQRLQKQLNMIAELTECDELVLFERSTFLVLASSNNDLKLDSNRFEKISNTIKQFKLVTTCSFSFGVIDRKYRSSYEGFTIRDGQTIICMKPFTEYTSMMVVSSATHTSTLHSVAYSLDEALISVNLDCARPYFEEYHISSV